MLTILHPLVDFCSVTVLVTGGVTVDRWLAYNALAFALQMPLGFALDVWGRGRDEARPSRAWLGRLGFAAGCAFAAGGAVAVAFGCAGWWPLALACVGNTLFHLTAGASVLETSSGRSGPIGLFISTGALGLMAGQMVANGGRVWLVLPVAVALVAGAAWQTVKWNALKDETSPLHQGVGCGADGVLALPWIVAGLFALVVWRSWAGLLAGGMSSGAGIAFALAGAIVTWAGKVAGGYLADWRGRGRVVAVSLVGSALLCFVCSPSAVLPWLVLLFVAQLATGPVLSLMYDRCGRRAGTAFGLNCLGLFFGSLI